MHSSMLQDKKGLRYQASQQGASVPQLVQRPPSPGTEIARKKDMIAKHAGAGTPVEEVYRHQ